MDPKRTPGPERHDIEFSLKSFKNLFTFHVEYMKPIVDALFKKSHWELFLRSSEDLVSGRQGPFRAEKNSRRPNMVRATLGPARQWPVSFRTAPRAVQSEICSARKGPGSTLQKISKRRFFLKIYKKIFSSFVTIWQKNIFLWYSKQTTWIRTLHPNN